MSIHIAAQKGEISDIVLMPGDPDRCEFIAKNYLQEVKLVNDIRNMTGYTGKYKGKTISIIPSGMGMPSMGIYATELFTLYDVKTIIRIGTCGAYTKPLASVIMATEANTISNFAHEYNGQTKNKVFPSQHINQIITQTAVEQDIPLLTGKVFTSNVFLNDPSEAISEPNYDAVEMEAFALFYIAESLNKEAAALLTVADCFTGDIIQSMTPEEREQGVKTMIELALESTLKL